jgi:aminodeoxyfutalosine deaminase
MIPKPSNETANRFIQAMPKAELHVHLEGTVKPETVLKLAQRNHLLHLLPSPNVEELRRWFTFVDFPHFIQTMLTLQRLLCTTEDFATIVYECGLDMHEQNIVYREVTLTPYTHVVYQDKKLTTNDILAGLEQGRQRAKKDFGVEIRWVFDINRALAFNGVGEHTYNPEPAEVTLEFALAGREYGVIGFGLGGSEVNAPPHPFAKAFMEAKRHGLLSVPHAGETEGPESVRGAVFNLQADRIGHGVRATEDPDLVEILRERQIPLEICITSNLCLKIYKRLEEHPVTFFDRSGVVVTLNSDDPPLFNTTLSREYEILVNKFRYTPGDISRIARNAFKASGAPPELKNLLIAKFDQWGSEESGNFEWS